MTHILLTGASRGIGAACAAAFARTADARTADDRTADDRPVALALHATRPAPGVLAADFADPAAPRALWKAALDRLGGRIDVLVNNAGVFEASPLDAGDDAWVAQWERTMRINLTAAAELSRLAVLHWQTRRAAGETGDGRLVNVASRAAYRGDSPQHWHYAAAKAGMVGMTKSIARGYAADGILAFCVLPGFTMTGMAEDYLASRGGDRLLADIPLGRVATPDEVAEVIRWCALDAPPSMTGAAIDVNGASFVR